MAASCCRLLPPLRKLRVLRQWSGLYENTPDRQPIYGPVPQVSGLYLACGFSGHGFMLSPVTGLLVSRMIAGEETGFPVEKLGIERFERGELIREPSVV
jgi:sarcosine oxidase subunit beta